MDALGKHFLACAGLAGDEHGGICDGVALRGLHGFFEYRAFGADIVKAVFCDKSLVRKLLAYLALDLMDVLNLLHHDDKAVFLLPYRQEGGRKLIVVILVQLVVYRRALAERLVLHGLHLRQRQAAELAARTEKLDGAAVRVGDRALAVDNYDALADGIERGLEELVPVLIAHEGGDYALRLDDGGDYLIFARADAVVVDTVGAGGARHVVAADDRLYARVAQLAQYRVKIDPLVYLVIVYLRAYRALKFARHLHHCCIADDGELAPLVRRADKHGRDVVAHERYRRDRQPQIRRAQVARMAAAGDDAQAARRLVVAGDLQTLLIGVSHYHLDVVLGAGVGDGILHGGEHVFAVHQKRNRFHSFTSQAWGFDVSCLREAVILCVKSSSVILSAQPSRKKAQAFSSRAR